MGMEMQGCPALLLRDQAWVRWWGGGGGGSGSPALEPSPVPQHRNTKTVILIKKLLKSLVTG